MKNAQGSNGMDAQNTNLLCKTSSVLPIQDRMNATQQGITLSQLLRTFHAGAPKMLLAMIMMMLLTIAVGCGDRLAEANNSVTQIATAKSYVSITTATPQRPQRSEQVTSVLASDRNNPAARRALLHSSLRFLKARQDHAANVRDTTLTQLRDPVPIPVLPVTPGQAPLQNPVPIELIPTPKGIAENTEPQPNKSAEPQPNKSAEPAGADRPDEHMAKTPGGTKPPVLDVQSRPDPKDSGKTPALEPVTYTNWQKPDVTLFITGQQNGYIEPCGCTGLTKQKGGVARRLTFMEQLRSQGWDLLPVDAGNQIRRIGQQATIKYGWSTEALKKMKYETVGFGPADLRLNSIDLLQVCAAEDPSTALYISGNVILFDDESYVPSVKTVVKNGITIAVTTILDPKKIDFPLTDDVVVNPAAESSKKALKSMADADFKVICFFGEEDAAKELMQKVPGYDLIIAAGGYGEPHYEPQNIEGSKTKLIDTGYKGMYVGLVGLYKDSDFSYCRVPLTHEFGDAPEMRKLMGDYQNQLKSIGLKGLGLTPSPHPSGEKFVGTATCGKCHTSAMAIWEGTEHAGATDSIVNPPEDRGDVPRHFDPECISCHVTGWNPQKYLPYETGYENLQASEHLLGNGCENCHGPGKSHSMAEEEGSGIAEAVKLKLRKSMQLPLSRAKEHCMKCHDLDNSPDFHDPDAFEDIYWPEVEHEGKD